MRKVFDDAAGKHVAKPEAAPAQELFEPAPHVVAALEIKCPDCNAKPGQQCASIIDASHYRDVPHAGRIDAARRSA